MMLKAFKAVTRSLEEQSKVREQKHVKVLECKV
jgi:hypothetical protein